MLKPFKIIDLIFMSMNVLYVYMCTTCMWFVPVEVRRGKRVSDSLDLDLWMVVELTYGC